LWLAAAGILCPHHVAAGEPTVDELVDAIRQVGREGAGFDPARAAASRLRQLPVGQVSVLLDAMEDVNPIAENWLRGLVFDVVRNAPQVPLQTLCEYSMDLSRNSTGRGMAMELVRRESPSDAERLIAKCLNDPSLPLREMAVQQQIEKAERLQKEDRIAAEALYRGALIAARHPQQVADLVKTLRDLGAEDVNTATAFAMICEWKSLAPLNNVAGVGFDTEYPPEKEFRLTSSVNLDASYDGKNGVIQWRTIEASADQGEVDLAAAYDKEKGAVAYLFAEFRSSQARQAQARLGCINANKVWINGNLIMANEVYHSGSMIDQYIGNFQLKKGINRLLLKICQNEQEESWAQEWQFQFRITDLTGKGLRSGE
jgi:hypothetical protein